jgi:hypothetical protein
VTPAETENQRPAFTTATNWPPPDRHRTVGQGLRRFSRAEAEPITDIVLAGIRRAAP